MGNKTGIEWTDATWNPIRGCRRVSNGCEHCYAEAMAHRFSGPGQPYEGLTQIVNGHPVWTGKVALVEKHLLDPLKDSQMKKPVRNLDGERLCGCDSEHYRPRRIFVNSMSDLFHPNVPDVWIDRIFAVMALCPQHIFQVVTKRPERMLAYFQGFLPPTAEDRAMRTCAWVADAVAKPPHAWIDSIERVPRGVPNLHLGVSVEDQATADQRIPLLLQTPAAVRFISADASAWAD